MHVKFRWRKLITGASRGQELTDIIGVQRTAADITAARVMLLLGAALLRHKSAWHRLWQRSYGQMPSTIIDDIWAYLYEPRVITTVFARSHRISGMLSKTMAFQKIPPHPKDIPRRVVQDVPGLLRQLHQDKVTLPTEGDQLINTLYRYYHWYLGITPLHPTQQGPDSCLTWCAKCNAARL